jgi:hypothetical protein
MPVDLRGIRPLRVILVAALGLGAAGCSLMNGDFAPRAAVPTAVATGPSDANPLEVRPAVLVQEGATAAVATGSAPRTANLEGLPPLPQDRTATATVPSSSQALSPDEKARVIAELEALARGEVPPPTPVAAAKADCAAAPVGQPPATIAAAATPPAGCAATPKPALRP